MRQGIYRYRAIARTCPLLVQACLCGLVGTTAAWGSMGGANLTPRLRSECVSPGERARIRDVVAADQALRKKGAAGRQGLLAPYLFFPQAGNLLDDLFVGQYVDLDHGAGAVRDWNCSDWTYDGHTGLDSDIRSFSEQEIGVPVFAVRDGVVVDAHDGEPDRNTSWNNAPANYVVLYHGDTHYTLYYHLKRGSVSVARDQRVRAGAQIGLTGSSGNSTWPHLHFESVSGSPGSPFDPNVGPCSSAVANGWAQPIPIARETLLTDLNVTDAPSSSLSGAPGEIPRRGAFAEGPRDVGFWIQLAGLPAGSTWRTRYLRPDGSAELDTGPQPFNNGEEWHRAWFWWQYRVNLDRVGVWRIQLDINGATLARAPFTVVASADVALNQAPYAVSVALDPPAPTTGDVVFCRVTQPSWLDDPDYDVVRYRYQWSVGGRVLRDVITAARSDAIPWGMVSRGEVLRCQVTPSDGLQDGPGAAVQAAVVDLPNRAPVVPELLSPEEGAPVSHMPTLRARATDPDGDACRVVLEVAQGSVARQVTTDLSESGADTAATIPEEQALAPGTWSWRARSVDARGASSEWSSPRALVVSRVPGVPDLLSPLDGAVASPAPAFRLRVDVPGGGPARLELEVTDGVRVRIFDGGSLSSGAEASFPLPAGEALGPGVWRWRARILAADGTAYAWSYSPSFRVPSPPPAVGARAGLEALGLPAVPDVAALAALGLDGARVAAWDAALSRYVPLTAFSVVQPGLGYWVESGTASPLRFTGRPAAGPYAVDLRPGWNLVSAPFPDPLVWDAQAVKVRRDGGEKSLFDAAAAGWVDDSAWQWLPAPHEGALGEYCLVTDAGALPGSVGRIQPWRAFWIRAQAACSLVLAPSTRSRSEEQVSARSARGWVTRLRATGDRVTSTIVVGAGGGRALSMALPPDPPAAETAPRMVIAGAAYPVGADIRAETSSRLEWELTVSPGGAAGSERITVTWPDLGALPKSTSLTLVDSATGARRNLRTTPAYTLTTDGPRRLLLVAAARIPGLPLVTGLSVEGGRGRSGRVVRFTLSTEASVDLDLLSPSGGVVAAVARSRASTAGLNQVGWAGEVPPGIYLLRARASTEEGSQSQAVFPVAVVR